MHAHHHHHLLAAIFSQLLQRHNFTGAVADYRHLHPVISAKLSSVIVQGEKLQFVLPAFPAKSGNREKTLSSRPDLGEIAALENLHQMAQKISEIYTPGAEVIICSDGRVFSDLVGIREDDVSLYRQELKKIVHDFKLSHLKFFDLEDEFKASLSFDQMRFFLEKEFGSSLEILKREIQTLPERRQLFNGIHRFLKEDFLVVYADRSKNQIHKLAKEQAYHVVLRSNAWSALVEKRFPQAFRLSIHPQSLDSLKFPIKLIKGDEQWGTPWHRVPVLEGKTLRLVKHHEAIKMGATKKEHRSYSYFELRSAS